ncbi:MAG TPA: lysophospholipid acyltransferase family protein [Gaiellaceae bacterium]|nr:lysophospholipid acyltransferase family protein [Gaiellaceae bacterium]
MRDAAYYARLDYSRWNRPTQFVQRLIALLVRATMRVRVDGLERIPPSGPAIIAGNHLSLLDSVVVIPYLRRPVILLLAEELRVWPWVAFVYGRLGNAIVVRRGSGDRRPVDLGAAVLHAGGIVAVAPEGRRSRTGGLERGRNGVARLAVRSGAPVVPVAIWGQERAAANWRRLRRVPVEVRFGAPRWFDDREAGEPADVTTQIMVEIARLLPREYRGVYATEASAAGGRSGDRLRDSTP